MTPTRTEDREGQVDRAATYVLATGLHGSLAPSPDGVLDSEAWAALLSRCRAQRMTGLLWQAVESGRLPTADGQPEQALVALTEEMAGCLVLEALLVEISDLLADAGVEVRLLKGPAVARLDYPDPAWRSFADLDLLVRGDDFGRAVDALSAAGFRRRFPEPRPGFDRRFNKGSPLVAPSGLELDLHRTFVMGPFGLTIDLAGLWVEPPRQVVVGGTMVPALSDVDRFLHACFHAALGDAPPRLVPHRDVVQMALAAGFPWPQIKQRARAWRAEPVVSAAITAAWGLLQVADITAASAWAARTPPTEHDRRDLAVYRDLEAGYADRSIAAVRALPSLRDRVAFVRALALPSDDYLQGRARGVARLRAAAGAWRRRRAR